MKLAPALLSLTLLLPAALAAEEVGNDSFHWQGEALAKPVGGEKFAASAFIHPLKTPSGFVLTNTQPIDHLHHFGIWWPWKFIEVDGARYNTWEIQMGEGAHVATAAKKVSSEDGVTTWELHNQTLAKPKNGEPFVALTEVTRLSQSRAGDANIFDIEIRHEAKDKPVTIVNYRYSGFTWRGSKEWNKDNSLMTTSGGKGRDDANGTQARWVLVSGDAPNGKASMLLLSAASSIAGAEEQVRVWDAKSHNGAPFVNFNPVMSKSLELNAENKAVSHRKYRVIAADRAITPEEAEKIWREWMGS
ncbi:MAG: PmoA family protein [Akkermansiaceae bacterium]|jgi:hypothetical protein|nr:PmoA family protein [Akkermansiaceae bacterium]